LQEPTVAPGHQDVEQNTKYSLSWVNVQIAGGAAGVFVQIVTVSHAGTNGLYI